MPFRFSQLLAEAGIPLAETRLLRHQTNLPNGRTPLDLWRTDMAGFEEYQSYQTGAQRAYFRGRWWASFVGTREGRTMFVGLYEVGEPQRVRQSYRQAASGLSVDAELDDHYPLRLSQALSEYAGRLYIDWGGGSSGKRSWRQRADQQEKVITELHLDIAEHPFPGLLQLAEPLSSLAAAPPAWVAPLQQGRGVYLLTCPSTGEQYVGAATGVEGFWGRWMSYAANGHGGNVALIAREKTDWIASVLQVAGSADTADDILALEGLWKRKLATRSLGLNRN